MSIVFRNSVLMKNPINVLMKKPVIVLSPSLDSATATFGSRKNTLENKYTNSPLVMLSISMSPLSSTCPISGHQCTY